MTRPWVGVAMAFFIATALTVVMAWPVVRAPSQMIFGHEIVGRHYDAYTVMFQMASSGASGPYAQPLTDRLGWLLARVLNPVAAYNVLVLFTFPLTAAATYALSRYLFDSHAAALVAALAFAFAPFHLAQAAYHPHIAQTQWLPPFFLAMFALVDRPTIVRAAGLALASAALVLSNDYGGFIGAVVAPIALVAYFLTREHRRWRVLFLAAAEFVGLAVAAIALVWVAAPQVFVSGSPLAFPRVDIAIYRARWWSYVVAPVDHPVFGAAAGRLFARANIVDALLEQQLYVGAALIILAAIALIVAIRQWRTSPALRAVLAFWIIGGAAAFISLGPLSGDCTSSSWTPACRLYEIAPMFRSYARFGVVTALAAAITGGVGFAWLAKRSRAATLTGWGLALCLAFEFWPLPWRAHDVLPSQGHRWLAGQPTAQRSLDCVRPTPAEALVPWLMNRNLEFLSALVPTCTDPELPSKLAVLHFTHVIVRSRADASPLAESVPGLALAGAFPDSRVYFVTAGVPPFLTMGADGFYAFEHENGDWWRWMGSQGQWAIRNTTTTALRVVLDSVLDTAGRARVLTVTLDGAPAAVIDVHDPLRRYTLGPWSIAPGDHTLTFMASGPPLRPSDSGRSTDSRFLTVAFRNPRWIVQ